MPIYTVPGRSPTGTRCTATLQKPSSNDTFASRKASGQQLKSRMLGEEKNSLLPCSQNKAEEVNRTYVISACEKVGDASTTFTSEGRLTLQRRTGVSKKPVSSSEPLHTNATQGTEELQTEKRLTLRRRVRTGSTGKSNINQNIVPRKENLPADAQRNYKVTPPQNINDTDVVKPNLKLAEGQSSTKLQCNLKSKGSLGFVDGVCKNGISTCLKDKTDTADTKFQNEIPKSEQLVTSKCINRLSGELNEKSNINKVAGKQRVQHLMIKHNSLERPRTPAKSLTEGFKLTPKNSTFQDQPSLKLASNEQTPHLQILAKKTRSVSNSLPGSRSSEAEVNTEALDESSRTEGDVFKVKNSKVIVAVRVRPFSNREKTENSLPVICMSGSETTVQNPSTNQVYSFSYDFSFWSFDKCCPNFASQAVIYQALAVPLLERAFEGYNACLFAYGQTGSGKSYTMMGFDEDRGIIPRLCEDLFNQIAQMDKEQILYHLEMSFFEIYNEKIHDLLVFKAENGQKKQLRVREHPVLGPYVEGLTVNVVRSYSDIQSWLELGNKQRATAATVMNDKSSRSHSVFTLVMTQTKVEFVNEEQCDRRLTSHINLIDLAGSECCAKAQTTGERLKEGVSINKSLLTLGRVISALSKQFQNGKKTFIPYRESVLTWLLKESLGGNSQTTMIATVSPAASSMEETLSTLRYAKQACSIINIAKVNEDVNVKLIRELKAEIERMKAAQKSALNTDREKYRRYLQEITSLRVELHQQERNMAEMQRAWKEKFEQAEKRKLEDIEELQKAGIAFKMDNHLPNLVNLNEDPQLSEVLLYMIKEGETTVGRCTPNSRHDIQLSGVLIADDHCVIKNAVGQVSIIPLREAKTYVNGKCILNPTVLHHGDRVILGGDHYFRFNHPAEVQKVKTPSCGTTCLHDGPKDFEFAKNELLIAQRTHLESEIEEARLKAKEEMMQSVQIAKEMVQQELTSQKEAYESKIKSLEAEVREESRKKQIQEMNNQKAATKIQELEKAKQNLELELQFNKKRLEMETLATKQALEDHTIRHAKILEALEAEKQKIGCSSDISSMVTEAWSKVNQTVKQTMKYIGHLAVVTTADISFPEENNIPASSLQEFVLAIYDGVGLGLEFLIDAVQEKARMVQKKLLKQCPQNEIQNRIKDNAVALARFLENNISYCRKKEIESQLPGEESLYREIKKSTKIAVKYLELEQCLTEVCRIVSSMLQGLYRNTSPLRSFAENISVIGGYFSNYFSLFALSSANNPIQKIPRPFMNLDELDSLVDSLIMNFELEQGQPSLQSQTVCSETTETQGGQVETGEVEFAWKWNGTREHTETPELSPGRIEWV
ncbi:PREDICTED: kinesin-like protein KIF14 [Lepidothrix coronata]|uniref:Kinesin-like protein KIF14 n=1 Tax=Lepidothrix coronata TaxID=321398 RepID=A0A6J0INZ0_9PASS|nr:PREDICTED: kinesin-like protein KIF14 [Lepidothrix coronata]